jgi:excisionase family DNA binding protein
MSDGRDAQLALAFVEALDDRALDVLADALASRLGASTTPPAPVAYTVASLASEVGLSERVIRSEIHSGELPAVKRGRNYLIARDAVEAWAAPAPAAGRTRGQERPSRERGHRPVMASALARLDGERRGG